MVSCHYNLIQYHALIFFVIVIRQKTFAEHIITHFKINLSTYSKKIKIVGRFLTLLSPKACRLAFFFQEPKELKGQDIILNLFSLFLQIFIFFQTHPKKNSKF